MKILLISLKETFALIWKNKMLFILLFILQIIFFSIFSYITITYQMKILESAKEIMDYLSQQKLDEASVASNILDKKSILGDDPLSISRNFNTIVRNFKIYLVTIFFLTIFSISINWTITFNLTQRKKINLLLKYFYKIFAVALVYLGLIFFFFFSLFNISLFDVEFGKQLITRVLPFLIISIVLLYFMFISVSLLHKTELKSIVQKTLSIGIRKAHYIIFVFLVNIAIISIAIALMFYFIEKNFLILMFSLLLLIFSFVFGRIFLIQVVEKLS